MNRTLSDHSRKRDVGEQDVFGIPLARPPQGNARFVAYIFKLHSFFCILGVQQLHFSLEQGLLKL